MSILSETNPNTVNTIITVVGILIVMFIIVYAFHKRSVKRRQKEAYAKYMENQKQADLTITPNQMGTPIRGQNHEPATRTITKTGTTQKQNRQDDTDQSVPFIMMIDNVAVNNNDAESKTTHHHKTDTLPDSSQHSHSNHHSPYSGSLSSSYDGGHSHSHSSYSHSDSGSNSSSDSGSSSSSSTSSDSGSSSSDSGSSSSSD